MRCTLIPLTRIASKVCALSFHSAHIEFTYKTSASAGWLAALCRSAAFLLSNSESISGNFLASFYVGTLATRALRWRRVLFLPLLAAVGARVPYRFDGDAYRDARRTTRPRFRLQANAMEYPQPRSTPLLTM